MKAQFSPDHFTEEEVVNAISNRNLIQSMHELGLVPKHGITENQMTKAITIFHQILIHHNLI